MVLAPAWLVALRIGAAKEVRVVFALELRWEVRGVRGARLWYAALLVGAALVLEVVGVLHLVVLRALTIPIGVAAAGVGLAVDWLAALLIGASLGRFTRRLVHWRPLRCRTAAVGRAHDFVAAFLVAVARLREALRAHVRLVHPFRGATAGVLLAQPCLAALRVAAPQTVAGSQLHVGLAAVVVLTAQRLAAPLVGIAWPLGAPGESGVQCLPLRRWLAGEILAVFLITALDEGAARLVILVFLVCPGRADGTVEGFAAEDPCSVS
mmetsp:Transcript_41583/g.99029  ORF Transcript_41583/g.99029 Transcript_41583/m.99029 type:complete len:266 (-) Transcript_41583:817-1614(-)